uniref:Uncharacterized protein n=2 Tax=Caenorhabditis japonica TaxID=281687 RepID=A0A8R1HLN1_CAEJA
MGAFKNFTHPARTKVDGKTIKECMIVRSEQENVSPSPQSSNPSNPCMVLRAGAIPASLQTFPGMEHDRGLFNGLTTQDGPLNGISGLVEDSNSFDDEREIEAAAAASEAHLKETLTLPPLHINVNECSKNDSGTLSSNSEPASNGSVSQRKGFQQTAIRNIRDYPAQRPSTSTTIMGPPTISNAPVLLSPAGNLHNGYQRMPSGDSAPSSPSFMRKSSQIPHPLAVPRPVTSSSHRGNANSQPSRPPSSTASPQNGRKEHEMTRRRALVDRIAKSRGADYVHLLPQVEALTHTQTSIMLRKHRGSLQANGVPYSLQQLIDCTVEADRITEVFVQKIKDANEKRTQQNDFDEMTDVSDLEEDLDEASESQKRNKKRETPRWTPKRMRYSGMLSRVETLLAEKIALMGMLRNQKNVMDASCGVRFSGEETMTRRRRQLNGMYYLYDKQSLRRATPEKFGCARAMPVQSWTNRKPHKNVFSEEAPKLPAYNPVLKTNQSLSEKWVTTAQYTTVSHMTNGEKREVLETDYEEYKAGEGLQQVNELSAMDPMEFIASSEFTPFEERQMAYMYRLSTAPSSTIRKKHGRAIYFETDDRKNSTERSAATKNKLDKKKERKRVEEASSDEEEPSTPVSKKKPRGRPVAAPVSRKRPSRPGTNKPHHTGIYLDYLFEDYMNEDICVKHLPSRVVYRQFQTIHVPEWSQIDQNYWDNKATESASTDEKRPADDLLISVAQQHHKLMHMERQRVQKETEKKNRNRQSTLKTAAAAASGAAASNPSSQNLSEGDFPPFDMRQFESNTITSRRRFASIEKPFEVRDFLSNTRSESSN